MLDTDAQDVSFINTLANTRLDLGMDKYVWVHPDDH